MKTRDQCDFSRSSWGVVLLIWVFVTLSPAWASKVAPNLTRDEVATVWIGLSDGEVYAYRLSLQPEGKGSGVFAKKDQEPFLFEITRWIYRQGKIEISGRFVDESAAREEIHLEGEIVSSYMSLVDRGPDWKLGIELRREAEILDWLAELRSAMEAPEEDDSCTGSDMPR